MPPHSLLQDNGDAIRESRLLALLDAQVVFIDKAERTQDGARSSAVESLQPSAASSSSSQPDAVIDVLDLGMVTISKRELRQMLAWPTARGFSAAPPLPKVAATQLICSEAQMAMAAKVGLLGCTLKPKPNPNARLKQRRPSKNLPAVFLWTNYFF